MALFFVLEGSATRAIPTGGKSSVASSDASGRLPNYRNTSL
jgi:hypothetical protein